jgi:hypothetical protein
MGLPARRHPCSTRAATSLFGGSNARETLRVGHAQNLQGLPPTPTQLSAIERRHLPAPSNSVGLACQRTNDGQASWRNSGRSAAFLQRERDKVVRYAARKHLASRPSSVKSRTVFVWDVARSKRGQGHDAESTPQHRKMREYRITGAIRPPSCSIVLADRPS